MTKREFLTKMDALVREDLTDLEDDAVVPPEELGEVCYQIMVRIDCMDVGLSPLAPTRSITDMAEDKK